jgi:hypothetical protein
MSREMTGEECRDALLAHLRALVVRWEHESRVTTVREKLDGLVFSILVALDGHADLPAFRVIPDPHPDDQGYDRVNGDNWWPEDVELPGLLHDHWYPQT